jgi:hypothetical protein
VVFCLLFPFLLPFGEQETGNAGRNSDCRRCGDPTNGRFFQLFSVFFFLGFNASEMQFTGQSTFGVGSQNIFCSELCVCVCETTSSTITSSTTVKAIVENTNKQSRFVME